MVDSACTMKQRYHFIADSVSPRSEPLSLPSMCGKTLGCCRGSEWGFSALFTWQHQGCSRHAGAVGDRTNHGSIWALVIAIVPRVLVGILPALVYRLAQNRFGAGLAAFVGTATNTLLVLSFIFLFFHDVTKQTFGALLASIITGNSIAEVIIAVILTMAIVPALSKARGNS